MPPLGPSAPGAPVEVELAVGMDFPASLSALDPERVTVLALGPGGLRAPVTLRREEEQKRTLATFTPTAPGQSTVSAVTRPNTGSRPGRR